MITELHLAKDALPLHLFFERFERLVDIVVTDENLHACFLLNLSIDFLQRREGQKRRVPVVFDAGL